MSAKRVIGAGIGMLLRGLRGLVAGAALVVLLGGLAHAGTNRFEILALTTTGSSGNGAGIPVRDLREITVFASCTASSSPTSLDLFLQSSSDGGTTWYDLTAETTMATDGDGTETAAAANKRDVLDAVATCASAVHAIGRYRVFGDLVRARWFITGTSFTFVVKAIGKT